MSTSRDMRSMERTMNRRQLVISLGAFGGRSARRRRGANVAGKPQRVGVMMAIAENDPEGLSRVESFRAVAAGGWAGSTAATLTSTSAGTAATSRSPRRSPRSSSIVASKSMVVNGTPGMDALASLWAPACRSFSSSSATRSAQATSPICRGPAPTSPASARSSPRSPANGLQLLRQVVAGPEEREHAARPEVHRPSIRCGRPSRRLRRHTEFMPHRGPRQQPRRDRARVSQHRQAGGSGPDRQSEPVNTVNRQASHALANEHASRRSIPFRFYVREGALLAYGFNAADQFRRAANYVSRILKGEKAGDLPVQAPSLFEFGINLKTAKAMGSPSRSP